MPVQVRVFQRLQSAHSALFRAADRHLRDTVGVSSAQQAILFMLAREDGLLFSAVAKRLGLGKPGLSGLIDRLEANGFVERRPNPEDARGVCLHILPKGLRSAKEAAPVTKAINRELLAPFSEDERETIARFLDHISNNAREIVAQNITAQAPQRTSP